MCVCLAGVGQGSEGTEERKMTSKTRMESQGNYGGQEERTVGKGESREEVRQGHVGPDGNF